MDIDRSEIANGVNFTLIRTDKFKSDLISVQFIAPLDEKTAAEYALFPQVMMRGCEKYPSVAALARRKKSIYDTGLGTVNTAIGENHVFGFESSILNNRYAIDGMDIVGEAVGLMFDVIKSPVTENGVFKKEYVESEKKRLTDRINSQKNNKASYSVGRCREEMCRGERFAVSVMGTVETVEAATPESVFAAYRRALENLRVEIIAVGGFDLSLKEKFKELFSGVKRDPQPLVGTEVLREPRSGVRHFEEIQKIKQGNLVIGFRTGSVFTDGDYAAADLATEIYGGSPISKLFMNVRERLSLCYHCSAFSDSVKGVMMVRSGIDFAKYAEAKAEIYRQLELMKNGEITDEELDGAKKSLINFLHGKYDSNSAIKGWYLDRILCGRIMSIDDYADEIGRVTKEQVVAKAAGFRPDLEYFLKGDGKDE